MAIKSTTKTKAKAAPASKAASNTKSVARKTPVTRTVKRPAKAKPVAAKPAVAAPAAGPQKITFAYFAPEAGSVLVAGDFTKWEAEPIRLVKEKSGNWKTTVALKPGKYQYRLLVDGQWQNDPGCPDVHPNEFGSANCVLSVAA